jgi:motility quorum-sensing regulator / GCU-specific mRNA interferase toxin
MEKRRPTYDLNAVKEVLGTVETLAITRSALSTAYALGFDRAGIAAVILGIGPGMFVKSMTTLADHRAWQDVYHVPSEDLILYIKIQADVVTEFRVVSFKEKCSWRRPRRH